MKNSCGRALAACAVYVDLNPIRAKMAESLTDSHHSSIQRRCKQAKRAAQPNDPGQQDKDLLPFAGNPRENMPTVSPLAGNLFLPEMLAILFNTLASHQERLF